MEDSATIANWKSGLKSSSVYGVSVGVRVGVSVIVMLGVSDGRSVMSGIAVSVSVAVAASVSGGGVADAGGATAGDGEAWTVVSEISAMEVTCNSIVALASASGVKGEGVTDGVSVGKTNRVGIALGSGGAGSQAANSMRNEKTRTRRKVIISYLPK